jgi:carboxypeptidase family protein
MQTACPTRVVPLLLFLSVLPGGFAQSSTISGTLVDAAGKAVSGVWVTALRTAPPPVAVTDASGADGGFVLSGLAAGEYRICAQSPDGKYLDPCWWSPPLTMPATAIRSGETRSGIRLTLKSAATLKIRVDDPLGLLLGANSGRDVFAGVITDAGVFRNAVVKARDSRERTLEVPIPFDTPVRLLITGVRVTLTDGGGKAVPSGGGINQVSLASGGASALAVSYSVSGVLP